MGEVAALLTAVCWAVTSLFTTSAGRKVGSVAVNRIRLIFAVILLLLAHLILLGKPWPTDASLGRWFWMGASGVAGLVLGDSFLFQSYVMIGPRLGTLIMAIVPVFSAIIAWLFLGEKLTLLEISGILLAVGGIMMVVLERGNGGSDGKDKRHYLLGVLAGIGGAVGQAAGLVLSKKGLEGGYPTLSGVLMRMVVAMVVLWAIAFALRQGGVTFRRVWVDRSALRTIFYGSITGPFIGVWLSLVAVQAAFVGIASTLMALTPVIMLPVVYWVYKESVSRWAVFGTAVALTGVGIIFLVG